MNSANTPRLQCGILIRKKNIIPINIRDDEGHDPLQALYFLISTLEDNLVNADPEVVDYNIDFNGDNTYIVDDTLFEILKSQNDNLKKISQQYGFPLTSKLNINESDGSESSIHYFSDDAMFLEELIDSVLAQKVPIEEFPEVFIRLGMECTSLRNENLIEETKESINSDAIDVEHEEFDKVDYDEFICQQNWIIKNVNSVCKYNPESDSFYFDIDNIINRKTFVKIGSETYKLSFKKVDAIVED